MKEAILYDKLKNNEILCRLCSQYCRIKNNRQGKCHVRVNKNGTLFSESYGRATALAVDPIEKKPFYHFKPGSKAFSIGTPGCNFTCLNCQNWNLSQISSEIPAPDIMGKPVIPPKKIAAMIAQTDVQSVAYTYSEPTIFFEYAKEIIEICKNDPNLSHLDHLFVSNGYLSNELIDLILDENLIDGINIDLKFMSNKKYQEICGANLKPVKNSIERFISNGVHVEINNLLIPGLNDSHSDIRELGKYLSSVDKSIPVHISRFHPAHQMSYYPATPLGALLNAYQKLLEIGMNYVYIGNVSIGGVSNTYCPDCGNVIIERNGYNQLEINMEKAESGDYNCTNCGKFLQIY